MLKLDLDGNIVLIMEGKKLTVDERATAESYRNVSRNASQEAEALTFATNALVALTDPSLRSRRKVLKRIQELQDDSGTTKIDLDTEIYLEGRLRQSSKLIKSKAESAGRVAVDAAETSEHIEQNGLPK